MWQWMKVSVASISCEYWRPKSLVLANVQNWCSQIGRYFYLSRGGYVIAIVRAFVCLFACYQDYVKSFRAITMKPCRIMEAARGGNR